MPDRLLRRAWFVRWVIPVAGAAIVAAFVLAAFAVQHQRSDTAATNRALCRAVNLNRTAMRLILERSARQVHRLPPGPQRRQAQQLLAHDLALVRRIDCASLTGK